MRVREVAKARRRHSQQFFGRSDLIRRSAAYRKSFSLAEAASEAAFNADVRQPFSSSLAGEEQMNLQNTALLTTDLAAAERWYTKLLGRGPDHRPMDTLVQWELFDHGGLAQRQHDSRKIADVT